MAVSDYFCCVKCGEKTVYDGYGSLEDQLSYLFGISEDDSWKIEVICDACTEDKSIRFYVNDE